MRASGPLDSFGAILSGLAKRLGLESRLVELRLQREWKQIVGEQIGSATWPDQIRFKKLHLVVQNSVWMQQLTFLKPTLFAKLRDAVGTTCITDIALRVGEIPMTPSPVHADSPGDSHSLVNDAALTEASAHAAAVQDPELRDHLTQVMAEALSRTSANGPASSAAPGF